MDETVHYIEPGQSTEELLDDYLALARNLPIFDEAVVLHRLELQQRGCLFVYTPEPDQRFARYRVYYGGQRPGWETAWTLDMPEFIEDIKGKLLKELAASEHVALKIELTIYEWTGDDDVKVSELPVDAVILIEDVGSLRSS